MRFAAIVAVFASAVLAAPTPQFEISGPLGGISWNGPLRGGEISGPLGSFSTNGLRNGGGFSASGPLGEISIGRGGDDSDDDE